MSKPNPVKVNSQMKRSMKAVSNFVPTSRLENITKVTFETESGKSFTLFGARVWKLKFMGNLAYQIRGGDSLDGKVPDLEDVLKDDIVDAEVKKDDVV
jgi:hypothetical protein